jgi:hypothetical protein
MMGKTVQHKSGAVKDTALVVLGWVAFLCGTLAHAKSPVVSAFLMAVARVLP